MSNFINRNTLINVEQVNNPEYPDPPWLLVPIGSNNEMVIETTPVKYRILTGDVLSAMSQAQRDVVDAQEKIERDEGNKNSAAAGVTGDDSPLNWQTRSVIGTSNQRDNYVVNRVAELQNVLLEIKASTGAADNIRAAIPDSFLATNTKERQEAYADYVVDIESGQADPEAEGNGGEGSRR